MKPLIFTQTHIRNFGQGRLFRAAHMLNRKLNPDNDFLIVDNASPLDPLRFLTAHEWVDYTLADDSDVPTHHWPNRIVRFPDSIGHPGKSDGKGDGPGRGICKAIEIGAASGYEWLHHIEADILTDLCSAWWQDRLTAPIACMKAGEGVGWDEWGMFFMNLPHAAAIDWVKKYDWRGERPQFWIGERLMTAACGDNLQRIDTMGIPSGEKLTPERLREGCRGARWITHTNLETFAEWLRMNGEPRLASELLREEGTPRYGQGDI